MSLLAPTYVTKNKFAPGTVVIEFCVIWYVLPVAESEGIDFSFFSKITQESAEF